ncbi:MAG: hypothetical protein HC906_06160 [Bacteroidales bacterium]|nr:hypothetical protein [Bacteroidales bacterium]
MFHLTDRHFAELLFLWHFHRQMFLNGSVSITEKFRLLGLNEEGEISKKSPATVVWAVSVLVPPVDAVRL